MCLMVSSEKLKIERIKTDEKNTNEFKVTW